MAKITVNPNQPRREFDQTALQELADSIAEIGIIQPITLRKLSDDEYQIIAGERRYRASQKAGLTTIPAYIRTADDENMMEMALIENIQREDLNAVEIASAGPVRTDTGTPERTYRQEPDNYRQLPASAQATGSYTDGSAKQTDRYGTCTCIDFIRRP